MLHSHEAHSCPSPGRQTDKPTDKITGRQADRKEAKQTENRHTINVQKQQRRSVMFHFNIILHTLQFVTHEKLIQTGSADYSIRIVIPGPLQL